MLHRFVALFLGVVLFLPGAKAATPSWVGGLWFKTLDEDGSPGDFIEFLPNGEARLFGYCRKFRAGLFDTVKWHDFAGDIYMTIEVPGKGPIALVFRPDQKGSALRYTSPRQRTTATYERRDPNAVCPRQ